MAYDTTWSDDETLDKARDALIRNKGFSRAEAEQAIIGLVESGFLIRQRTSMDKGAPQRDKDWNPPQGHLLPAAPQDIQIHSWGPNAHGLGKIISVEPQLPLGD
jgi:hypothetical protein